MCKNLALLSAVLLIVSLAAAQSTDATLTGRVLDPSGAAVQGGKVSAVNSLTGVQVSTETNKEGIYFLPNVAPGIYRIEVSKAGFKTMLRPDVVAHVQDVIAINFTLALGSVMESITVEGGAPLVNDESAAVSTVVDRQFADNLPMNGRSFQSLIELTPGVVAVPTNVQDAGQFSANGQRSTSNYWTVDGVSANIGIGVGGQGTNGNGMSGSLGSFSALGGTNSLVSVDAMQEFRIQTSTYAPEYGRTPGAQIAIATRSGTNRFHGTVFDYLRNDSLDANNWFNGTTTPPLPKARERQNDFGSTLSGPIFKDRTFFFFSYEGLRLRLPQTVLTSVPCDGSCSVSGNVRSAAIAAMQPFLNAYPLPNGTDHGDGTADFNASFSNPATLDAYSLRVDHKLNDKLTLFGRYNYSPSEIVQRGGFPLALSVVTPIRLTTQTGTVGATWSISPSAVNDLRFNYSSVNAFSHSVLDSFGGAVPLTVLPFPSPFTDQNGQFTFEIFSLVAGQLRDGIGTRNIQRQVNAVDTLSVQKGSHALKFGVDYRRLSPPTTPPQYSQGAQFIGPGSVVAAETGNASAVSIIASAPTTLLFRNLSAFAQDTWRAAPRLTVTYGLRWDVDFVPSTLSGPSIPAVTGFNLNDFSQLAIAPAGTPPFNTPYRNVAPRVGVAYRMGQHPAWETVIRGGIGVFYDLASAQTGALIQTLPPFGQFKSVASPPFPLSPANSAPPVIPSTGTIANVLALNPNLKLPYTLQWNLAFEQALGREEALSVSYVGAAGRRLLQTTAVFFPPSNPDLQFGSFVDNSATSDYHALQVQFKRSVSHGLQALASYSWSHSIDSGSASSAQVASNAGIPGSTSNRGSSDFDIRHAVSVGLTYDVPIPGENALVKAVLHGWSLESLIQARSAPPVDVSDVLFFTLQDGTFADIRPDLVPGQLLYLFGANCASVMRGLGNLSPGQGCPGGKALNPNAFTDPPFDPVTFAPLRQGNVPRNFLRGFGATQWDFAVHRDFPIHDSVKLQFRAEMFNFLNHPNFGPPSGSFVSSAFGGPAGFGLSTQTLNQSLAGPGTQGAGSFNPLYQIGGPRSVQVALKLSF